MLSCWSSPVTQRILYHAAVSKTHSGIHLYNFIAHQQDCLFKNISPYNRMVIQSHEVPSAYCMLAALSNWLFLAGFVVFPGTFTSLSQASFLDKPQGGRMMQQAICSASQPGSLINNDHLRTLPPLCVPLYIWYVFLLYYRSLSNI